MNKFLLLIVLMSLAGCAHAKKVYVNCPQIGALASGETLHECEKILE